MKARRILWAAVLLICVAGTASSKPWSLPHLTRLGKVLGEEGRILARKVIRPAAQIAGAFIILCTGLSCDTATTQKILTDLHQAPVEETMQANPIYYVIDNFAWPHTAVYVSPETGSMTLERADSIFIPLAALQDMSVLEHEDIGLEVMHVPLPDYDAGFIYLHYGKVTNFYRNGYLEVLIDSWEAVEGNRDMKNPKQQLRYTYVLLVDESMSASMGGVSFTHEENEAD